jgi:thiosulfate reductase/polysulfide reductase chain A
MNDTAWFSDVVLPEASYLERYDPLNIVGHQAFLRQPVIAAQGEGKSSLWIYKQLGQRLGLSDYFQYTDEEDYLKQQLAPLGVTLDQVRQKGYVDLPGETDTGGEAVEPKWNTPSGKIEIYSTTLASGGFAALPTWEEPLAPKPGEFYLLTGKVAQYTQMGTQNNQLLHKYADLPRLWMNTQTAQSLGLADDDMLEVTSPAGMIHIQLLATQAIRQDCVYLTPGFGHLSKGLIVAYGEGACDSDLHMTYTDPVSGSQALSQTFVTVKKIYQ